ESERAGAVGAVPALHPAEQLALEQRRKRHRDEQDVDDHERLDQADPPGLAHVCITSTAPGRALTCSSAARTTPWIRLRLTRARSSTEMPSELTRTTSPLAIPRTWASSGESSTSASARWNSSSG